MVLKGFVILSKGFFESFEKMILDFL
jgi:hypothetical protein